MARKVRGTNGTKSLRWYEKSMVRIVRGTKNLQMVRNVYGTKSLWYEKSGSLVHTYTQFNRDLYK